MIATTEVIALIQEYPWVALVGSFILFGALKGLKHAIAQILLCLFLIGLVLLVFLEMSGTGLPF